MSTPSPRDARSLPALLLLSLATATATTATTGCAAARPQMATPVELLERGARAAAAAPAPLDRSHFARDPQGQISEEALQKVLEAPIEIALPARVGVLPIVRATDWRGPAPSQEVPSGAGALAKALGGAEPFTLVTEMMAIPSGALGMEALRELGARYKLRYLLLYREEVARRRRNNGWAAGYATLIGAFFLPGQTLDAWGFVEASLLDVKTGLLLYTVRRPIAARRSSNVWHQDDKLDEMTARLVAQAGVELAGEVRTATRRFAEAARVESAARLASARLPPATGLSGTTPLGAAAQP